MSDRSHFLSPSSRYYGKAKPENFLFNANLQEFAQRVSLICGLETNGKISPGEAYEAIESLWQKLQQSKKQLGVGE